MVAAYVEYPKRERNRRHLKIYFECLPMVTAAVDKDLIKKNPCRGFVLKNDNMTLQKETFLPEEMLQRLVATHLRARKPEIHRIHLRSMHCGGVGATQAS